jgi:hypothetical protein
MRRAVAVHRSARAPDLAAQRQKGTGPELARMLATLLWVVGGAVALLAGLGALPGLLTGESGARSAATLQEAELRLGARVLLPAFQPARLGWPPSEIRTAGGRRGSVLVGFEPREGEPVQVVQATEAGRPIDAPLLEGRNVLASRRTTVGERPAQLATVSIEGVVWQELALDVGGRAVLLRTRGDVDELYRIAHSFHGAADAVEGGGRAP